MFMVGPSSDHRPVSRQGQNYGIGQVGNGTSDHGTDKQSQMIITITDQMSWKTGFIWMNFQIV